MSDSTDSLPASTSLSSRPRVTGAPDRPWHMRAWSGITFSAWIRVLQRHGFRISPTRVPMATLLSGISILNSSLSAVQSVTHGRRIRDTELVEQPIFVIGHWRAGTTLLHELLVQDANFTYPNTYACFSPNHFLLSEWWLKRMLGLFLPRQRPMDNMAIGWNLPQEDEWALCNMGLPSPYFKIMFPNAPPRDAAYQSLRELPAEARQQWRARFHWLLKALTVRESKRIVLKTPVHTFRIAELLEIFPRANFIHITRNPYVVVPSTMHTWRRMYRYHGLQIPRFEHLEQEVLSTLAEMVQVFQQDRALLPAKQFHQLSYESLTADPLKQLESIYEHFELPISSAVRESWHSYATRSSGYQTNRYRLDERLRNEIARQCSAYFQHFGYDLESVP